MSKPEDLLNLNQEDLMEIVKMIVHLGNVSNTKIETWNQDQDFDVEYILSEILRIVKNDTSKQKQFRFLIFVGLVRGQRISKILKTSKPAMVTELKNAAAAFNVKDSICDTSNRARTITLSRLRIALPFLAAQYLSMETVVRPVSIMTLNAKFAPGTHTFPLVLRDMSVAALIPNEDFNGWTVSEDSQNALSCLVGYAFLEARVLNQKKNKTDFEMLQGVKAFSTATWKLTHSTKNVREEFVAKYLTDKTQLSVIAEAVKSYTSSYLEAQ